MFRVFPILLLLIGCLAMPRGARAEDIRPPFGLEWGEQEERLQQRLAGAKAKIVEKRVVGGRDMWTVEGLIQTNLRRTVFYFRNSGLVEVELQYQNPDWIDSDYNSFLGQLRLKVEARYGQGKLVARSKSPEGNVVQTLVGYEWNQNNSAIQVIYFCAESPSQVYRTVSLHYKSLE